MYLSYSQISLFKECAKMWQAAYRRGMKQAPDENLIFGSAVHKVIENYITWDQAQRSQVLDFWRVTWTEMVAGSQGQATVWQASPEELMRTGERVFTSEYVLPVLDQVRPRITEGQYDIERKMEWIIEKGVPPILGYIDCICDDGVPLDFKTASRMWTPGRAKAEIQPLFYLSALDDIGDFDHLYRFRHLVITKGAVPVARLFETQRSSDEVEVLASQVLDIWNQIASGDFPANPSSWLCSPACPVFDECEPGQARWIPSEDSLEVGGLPFTE